MSEWTTFTGVLILVAGVICFILAILLFNFGFLWLRAWMSGAPVGFFNLVGMWVRRIPGKLIVDSRVAAVRSGLDVSTAQLESHYLAGGNVMETVRALIAADKAGFSLPLERARAIDLATQGTGKTVYEAVRTSVNPKVIDCPSPDSGKTSIEAVAKDGISLRVRARVTVRTNLDRFVGGAMEETIIARVGEGIVTTIGSATTYKDVLENPDNISASVLERGLDSGTAFQILSVDIADVDVADNIGARLQAEQAETDKRVAQAKAEVRRAAAVATEQEMVARVAEMRAEVTKAEAQVPLAMSEAFRSGNLGLMDYYRMKNIQADTGMRDSIAGQDGEGDSTTTSPPQN